jgi:hypothetical protein
MVRALLLTLLAVAGCAGAAPPLVMSAGAGAGPPDPAALVGWWRVADAPGGTGTGPTVLLDPTAIEVLDAGVALDGTWRADPDGRLVAHIDSGRSALDLSGTGADLAPAWLAAVAGFRVDGADRVLLDAAGAPTARLVPTAPTAGSGAVDPGRPAGPAERHAFDPAAPLTAPLRPAGPAGLAGRWVPADGSGSAHVELAADGTWDGSDGCSATGGRWVGGADGGFLAAAAAVRTLIACPDGVNLGGQLSTARRAAFDGDELVLLDVDGGTVGRFRRG